MRLDGCAGTSVAKREKCSEGHTSNRYRTLFHKEMEYAVMKGKPFARRSGKRAFGRRRKTKGAESGGRNAEGGRPKDADRGGSRNGGKGRAEAAERRAGHRPGTGPQHGGSYGGDGPPEDAAGRRLSAGGIGTLTRWSRSGRGARSVPAPF